MVPRLQANQKSTCCDAVHAIREVRARSPRVRPPIRAPSGLIDQPAAIAASQANAHVPPMSAPRPGGLAFCFRSASAPACCRSPLDPTITGTSAIIICCPVGLLTSPLGMLEVAERKGGRRIWLAFAGVGSRAGIGIALKYTSGGFHPRIGRRRLLARWQTVSPGGHDGTMTGPCPVDLSSAEPRQARQASRLATRPRIVRYRMPPIRRNKASSTTR
jgi:hypothetical protein